MTEATQSTQPAQPVQPAPLPGNTPVNQTANQTANQTVNGAIKPGWYARLSLSFEKGPDKTFVRRTHTGPLGMQRAFYPEPAVCHVTLLHPPGGIVGGDSLTISAVAQPGTNALLTTPGASKFYRSAGPQAQLRQNIQVDDASLEWFPQETIFFNGCQAKTETTIRLGNHARYCGWDIQCFGRPAGQHHFVNGTVDCQLRLLVDDQPVLNDRLKINSQQTTAQVTSLRGHCVSGTLLLYPLPKESVVVARAQLETLAGFACTAFDSILLVRYLGEQSEIAKQGFAAVWSALRKNTNGHAPSMPRIWST